MPGQPRGMRDKAREPASESTPRPAAAPKRRTGPDPRRSAAGGRFRSRRTACRASSTAPHGPGDPDRPEVVRIAARACRRRSQIADGDTSDRRGPGSPRLARSAMPPVGRGGRPMRAVGLVAGRAARTGDRRAGRPVSASQLPQRPGARTRVQPLVELLDGQPALGVRARAAGRPPRPGRRRRPAGSGSVVTRPAGILRRAVHCQLGGGGDAERGRAARHRRRAR